MWASFLAAVAGGLAAGLSAAAPWWVYRSRVVEGLLRARAAPAAYLVAAIPALLASAATVARLVGFTTGSLRTDVALIAVIIGIACSWPPIVRGALVLTGSLGEPLSAEGQGPRDESFARPMRAVAAGLSAVLFLWTSTWVVAPAYASLRACMDVESMLADLEPAAPNPAPLADALPYNPPEPGALYAFGFPMNLEQAATSRHDVNTREQLVDAGFVGGEMRAWYAADGRGIQADVFEFGTPEGAAAYQAAVMRHACQYSNAAFEAPLGGIGLQVRYETGDPIVEQISWVAGNRRYLIQHSALEVPPDHRRINEIRDASMSTWPSG